MTAREIATKAAPIIFSLEGNYSSINANDNGAVSIGKIQWHGTRALQLLQTIIKTLGEKKTKTYISAALYKEIIEKKDWSKRIFTTAEKTAVTPLLATDASKKAQDELAISDVATYVEYGMKAGLKDPGALIYYADFANQYGMYSALLALITKSAIMKDGGTITSMYNCTLDNTTKYLTRRKAVYNAVISNTDLGIIQSVTVEKAEDNTYTQKKFVKNIQKALGVTVDGIAGPKTLAATITVSATKNNKHAVVKYLQKYFRYIKNYKINNKDIVIDGIAGPVFTECVKKYQKNVVKLNTPDGEITAKNATWKKLLGL